MAGIIIFGASGQLGQCLRAVAAQRKTALIHLSGKADANILDLDALKTVFEKYQPEYCINCAAYTAVDKAEDNETDAMLINKKGVENLSTFCDIYNSTLIHISTDFVFKGDKSSPLTEQDETFPANKYGKTKLAGEKVIQSILKRHFIIRTSWLYSVFGNNFVKTMLKLGSERSELKVIADQIGAPTYGIDLAEFIFLIIEKRSYAYGIYHFSNEGVASWYDFAKAIFNIAKKPVSVLPVKTEEYITKATRPAYSLLDKSKVKKEFNINIPYWQESLAKCISELKNHN